jgi:hypothetical protein
MTAMPESDRECDLNAILGSACDGAGNGTGFCLRVGDALTMRAARSIAGIMHKRAKMGVGSTCLTADQVTVLNLEPMKMHPVVLEVPGLNSTQTKGAVSESDIQRVAFDPETELPSLVTIFPI